jgi:hypothetical protein
MWTRRTMISRSTKACIGIVAGWLLWSTRVIQVGSFLTAAAIRSRLSRRDDPGPNSESVKWPVQSEEITRLAVKQNPRALVTYHPEYHCHDPRLVLASLQRAAGMGFGWMRTDLRWNQILPSNSPPTSHVLSWYRQFLATSSKLGMKNMVVLSSPPKSVQQSDPQSRLSEWRRFVDAVVTEFGNHCDAYQLMNEPNNPVYRIFDLANTKDAVRIGAEIIRKSHQVPVVVNIATDFWGWQRYAEDLLIACGEFVDILGLDRYPGTWSIGLSRGWGDIIDMTHSKIGGTSTVCSDQRIAILETGYSTNTISRTQREQESYFLGLKPLFDAVKEDGSKWAFDLIGIYELVDADSSAGFDPEVHFGLMTTDLKEKAAVRAVRDLISRT